MKVNYYHAHLYYDEESFEKAKEIISLAQNLDYIEVGRVHEKPVGPHPMWSCQFLVQTKDLGELITWLIYNRKDLRVFIHPVGENDLEDHTIHTMWLGEKVELNLDLFKS